MEGTGATDIYEPETAAMGDLTIPMATTAGAHTIIVSLRQNMHAPLSPPAEDSLMITVMP